MQCPRNRTEDSCPIYRICTNPKINRTLSPCGPINDAADGDKPQREATLDASILDQVINRHYLDVINELSAHIDRHNQQSLPSTIPALRAITIYALRQSGASLRQIAGALSLPLSTIQRAIGRDTACE